MGEMINARARFGLDGDTLYDYVAKQYVDVGVPIECQEGTWDTYKVAELIRTGQSIETAFTVRSALTDKVEQADEDFIKEPVGDDVVVDPPQVPEIDPAQQPAQAPEEAQPDVVETSTSEAPADVVEMSTDEQPSV